MENGRLQSAESLQPGQSSDSLESTANVVPVAGYALSPQNNLAENLQVHEPGAPIYEQQPDGLQLSSAHAFKFSRHKAVITSTIIALIVILLSGISISILHKQSEKAPSSKVNGSVPIQQINLNQTNKAPLAPELAGGTKNSLLINGDIISRGFIKLSKDALIATIEPGGLSANQSYQLPDSSGTLCLDTNNCDFATTAALQAYATQVQLEELRGSIPVLGSPGITGLIAGSANLTVSNNNGNVTITDTTANEPKVSSLNGATGGVTLSIQGTPNQVSVGASGNSFTISTPQDINTGATPTFSGLIVSSLNCSSFGGGGALTTNGSGQLVCSDDDGGAGSAITGNGTSGALTRFTGAQTIGDSIITESGSAITVAGDLSATNLSGAGSGITALNANNVSSGTLADARLSTNVTLQGNTFNGASQLVQLNGSSQLPAVSGVLLTNLNASNLSSGTVPSARISGSYTGITGVGTITVGVWNGTSITDANVDNDLTISSTGTVDWAALNNYPASATCAAGQAVTVIADTVTCATFAAGSGSGNYIQNTTGNQDTANFNIRSSAIGSVTAKLRVLTSQTADVIQVRDSTDSSTVFSVSPAGNVAGGTYNTATISGGSLSATAVNGLSVSGGTVSSGLWQGTAIAAQYGGTGQSSYTTGDLLYASGTTALSKLAGVATGNALISGGVGAAPSWGKIGLATHVNGTLPVANGGTGTSTAFTQGSILFAGASGVYNQDNANFFWDNSNATLGVGTTRSGAINGTGNSRLVVQGSGSTSATSSLNVRNSSGSGSLFMVRDDGKVGIGTSTPLTTLDVAGTGRFIATIDVPDDTGTALQYLNYTNISDNVGATATQLIGLDLQGTVDAAGAGGTQETIGIFVRPLNGSPGAGTQNNYGIRIDNQGLAGSENAYGLYVNTQTGSTSNYAAVFQGGNVGIGTIAPAAKLSIETAANTTALNTFDGTVTTNIFNGTVSSLTGGWVGTASNHSLIFMTNNTNRAVLDNAGNLGIGVVPTTAKFEVAGNSLFKSTSTVALDVQNASNVSMFSVDTTNNTVFVGEATGSVSSGRLVISDGTTMATGVGAAINLRAKINSSGTYGTTAQLNSYKENSTNNDYSTAMFLQTADAGGTLRTRMRLAANGNVSIGANLIQGFTVANAKLTVWDTTTTPTNYLLALLSDVGGSQSSKFLVRADGRLVVHTETSAPTTTQEGELIFGRVGLSSSDGRIWLRSGGDTFRWESDADTADYSEYFHKVGQGLAGDVMVVADGASPVHDTGQVVRGSRPYDSRIVGVITERGTGNNNPDDDRQNNPNFANVGMLGHVPVKIAADSPAIYPGDMLTTSYVSGRAMKADRAGMVIGRALEAWVPGSGKDKIMMLVNPGWYEPADEGDILQGSFQSLDVLGQANLTHLNVTGATTTSTLSVTGNATVSGVLEVVEAITTAKITISGHLTVGRDTSGTIVIPAGQTEATVSFEDAYERVPKLTASANSFVLIKISEKTANGFKVQMQTPQLSDTAIDWIALEPIE